MDSSLLSKKYKVRKLTKNDIDIIYDLSKDNKIFYEYHPPFVTKESIINDLCESLRKLGFKSIRLGVDIGNPQSNHFWQKNNFKVIKEDEFIVMGRIL